jgi:predicted ArsR family transcriptional regulator
MTNPGPTKTTFQRKYTEEQVIDLLKENSIMSARQISDKMGCHKKTVESLIKKLLESDSINRVNVRTEAKPLWVYSLKNSESGSE